MMIPMLCAPRVPVVLRCEAQAHQQPHARHDLALTQLSGHLKLTERTLPSAGEPRIDTAGVEAVPAPQRSNDLAITKILHANRTLWSLLGIQAWLCIERSCYCVKVQFGNRCDVFHRFRSCSRKRWSRCSPWCKPWVRDNLLCTSGYGARGYGVALPTTR